ncbi:MAG: diguanylate cyclase [Chloroflexi bacterium]|nr:diguanylate cyclase [Chloroflexota bacterium]
MTVATSEARLSLLVPALHRLARARAWQRWMRTAFWAWWAVTLLWLLPIGAWSATRLNPAAAAAVAVGLIGCGGLIALLHRTALRMEPIRSAITRAALGSTGSAVRRAPRRAWLRGRMPAGVIVTIAVAVTLAVPVLRALTLPGLDGPFFWLLYPLAGMILAARFRARGACIAIVVGLALFGAGEAWIEGWDGLRNTETRGYLALTAMLIVAAPLGIVMAAGSHAPVAMMPWPEEPYARPARRRRTPDATAARFGQLVHNTSDILTVLRADAARWYVNPSVTRVLGYLPEELTGTDFFSFVHPDDMARVLDFYLMCLTRDGISPPVEFRCRDRDGGWRHVESIFNNLLHDPNVGGIVVTMHDITRRKRYEEQLARQALHDGLTGLPNRLLFMERLMHVFDTPARAAPAEAVLFIDLDRFKNVNDSLGHAAGDLLLITAAQRIAGNVRPSDTVARFGGDEFVVLLTNLGDPSGAADVAHRILDALCRPFEIGGRLVNLGGSIGIAVRMPAHQTPDDLLRDADAAMYHAKAAGRGCVVAFEPGMRALSDSERGHAGNLGAATGAA